MLGAAATLVLIVLLALLAVDAARITGLSSEEATLIQAGDRQRGLDSGTRARWYQVRPDPRRHEPRSTLQSEDTATRVKI